ncbi:Long-chain-fatty-acid--CoA ligase [Fulvivirga imtechensis AK7]|uniref:Long-chain-fatty-acid--CoA ligase n=1 Tax=Fulvivirga imtechensis AK7 TaxID=1237149 RepID=L8JR49_9BACT|nr:VOC family protein [Fulvivirga imtechensis]ELR69812.1 Long-chain-fatty-acid--CoA ligase [Fulvivirga imtechensis AK7]
MGLASQYLNRKELTDKAFVYYDSQRLYRSGDLGRWNIDGDLIFLGRKDDQLSFRGYRLEKEEIENAILKLPALVQECIVDVREVNHQPAPEVLSFIAQNYCGVKRVALAVDSVQEAFDKSIQNGAIPVQLPVTTEDELGQVEEASIKLYEHNEITFINRHSYRGHFKPGYKPLKDASTTHSAGLLSIDHIASEVRVNETDYWTNYLSQTIGTQLVQSIERDEQNKTGMILKISQSADKNMTFVMAEPEVVEKKSKVQENINKYGPGIHHLAFETSDMIATVETLIKGDVEFISFPPSYYDILREREEFRGYDIDKLQQYGILIDKEGDSYLLQKFIKPISDRPFFIYEIVQRVNGYSGFALKNINILKKAEEKEIMKVANEA